MNRYRMRFAPQTWKPKLNPWLVRCLRPLRMRSQRRTQRLIDVQVSGEDRVRSALQEGSGVMIMPNHASHADPFAIYAAADAVGTPVHIMAAWHVFHNKTLPLRWVLRSHGCFSVDREANDVGAFRQAVDILQTKQQPLVIFPEGEIYHCNERVTPFREGAAAIAVAAARRAERKIVCVPCAITYRFSSDPTESLIALMGDLEEAILWRRQTERPLPERIYRFAEALLAVKEVEYLQAAQSGPIPERIRALGDHILRQVEQRHGLTNQTASIPERVKAARRTILEKLGGDEFGTTGEVGATGGAAPSLQCDLDDLFLVVQSFSYPGDYVTQKPSVERMAETLDKFEEDVLRRQTASIRADRRASVQFGEPIEVVGDRKARHLTATLSQQVEDAVQALLDRV